MESWQALAEATRTSAGFFWKAGWAFVLGYTVSAIIQALVPKRGVMRHLGDGGARGIGLASVFGAISSSCSFAALSTARALVIKGATFREAVAFMFASTNLVIELGVLILIFLGWPYLAAEIVGGVLLIVLASFVLRATAPREWLDEARAKLEDEHADLELDFDWRARARSLDGWGRVGSRFVAEWQMVWKEILIGFTVAGLMAAFVPPSFWEALFLTGTDLPGWLVAIENALVGPLVAMATFIGSMGNIPLATVLAGSGVAFAGIMAFIYSDLVVPPLVAVNAKYYGRRVALWIAGVMYVVVVITALVLAGGVELLGLTPEPRRVVEEVTRFSVDYTFWMNLVLGIGAIVLVGLHLWRKRLQEGHDHGHDHDHGGDSPWTVKNAAVALSLALHVAGLAAWITGALSAA